MLSAPLGSLTEQMQNFDPNNLHDSKIELYLAFNFQSGLLNNAFKKAFGAIAQQLVSDFVRRADDVYR